MDDKMVIILDELKFDWKVSQLVKVKELWDEGYSIQHITKHFGSKVEGGLRQIELVLVIMHLEIEGFIGSRQGGLEGSRGE